MFELYQAPLLTFAESQISSYKSRIFSYNEF